MSIHELSSVLAQSGVAHVVVIASEVNAKAPPRKVKLVFKSSSERAKDRRKAKLYRQRNKAQLKLKAKRRALKMKHKKPNRILSERAKLVHKHFRY